MRCLKKTKKLLKAVAGAVYKKGYIINFEMCSEVPSIKLSNIVPLGDWYITQGLEWVCHSKMQLEEFRSSFLVFVEESERDLVRFEVDYMPFGKA